MTGIKYQPAAKPQSSSEPVCPLCGGPVRRIRRRFEDRFVSLFVKMYRYSCNSRVCGWEGCLRAKRDTGR